MKLFLVVLLANVWSAAVTAAPSSTPNFSFQQYGLERQMFQDITEDINKYWTFVNCVRNVVAEVVANSEFKSIWDETKHKIEELVQTEWPKCTTDITSDVEQAYCLAAVINKIEEEMTEFFKKMAAANKWDLLNKIKDNVDSKCIKPSNDIFQFDDELKVSTSENFLARFECATNVLGKVSKEHGLQSLWDKSQPQIVHHLDQWKECEKAGNAIFVTICQMKEGAASFVFMAEYVQLASAQDPTFKDAFGAEYKEKCANKAYVAELTDIFAVEGVDSCVEKLTKKIMCISAAITESVENTDFEVDWKAPSLLLEQLMIQLNACPNLTSESEAAECITNNLKSSYGVFSKFLSSVRETNYEAYINLKAHIKQKCY